MSFRPSRAGRIGVRPQDKPAQAGAGRKDVPHAALLAKHSSAPGMTSMQPHALRAFTDNNAVAVHIPLTGRLTCASVETRF